MLKLAHETVKNSTVDARSDDSDFNGKPELKPPLFRCLKVSVGLIVEDPVLAQMNHHDNHKNHSDLFFVVKEIGAMQEEPLCDGVN